MNKYFDDIIKNHVAPLNNRESYMKVTYPDQNLCPFKERVLLKMSQQKNINVLIIGGSLTRGASILPHQKKWTDVMTEHLNSGWYKGRFNVTNIAIGGFDIKLWIPKIDEFIAYEPDLIITDFTANDIGNPIEFMGEYHEYFIQLIESLPTLPALLFNLSFSLALKEILPNYAVDKGYFKRQVPVKDNLIGYYKFWKVSDFAKDALIHYRVPYTSFRDLIYPDFFHPPADLSYKWDSFVHPYNVTHKFMGDNVFFAIVNMINQSNKDTEKCFKESPENNCNKKLYLEENEFNPDVRPVCYYDNPAILMQSTSSIESKNFFNLSSSYDPLLNHWKFINDRRIYGWIYDEPLIYNQYIKTLLNPSMDKFQKNLKYEQISKNYILSFVVEVNNILQITYLKSYSSKFSSFLFWFNDAIHNAQLVQTDYRLPFSIPFSYTVIFDNTQISSLILPNQVVMKHVKKGKNVLNIFPVPKNANSLEELKVKILAIKSC